MRVRWISRCSIITCCLFNLVVYPFSASAFGPVGHETVAYIAQDRLSRSTLKKVQTIIGNNGDLASIANWADEIRPSQPKTAHWHFIDLPLRQDLTVHDLQKFCLTGISIK